MKTHSLVRKILGSCSLGLLLLVASACIAVGGSQTSVGRPEPRAGGNGPGNGTSGQPDAQVEAGESPLSLAKLAPTLLTLGPRLRIAAGRAEAEGFVRGRWPLVVDYRLEAPGSLQVHILTQDVVEAMLCFPNPGGGRRLEKAQMPKSFGKEPRTARLTIRAFASQDCSGPGREDLHLFGLGAGPRAVGSVAIHRLSFEQERIEPAQIEEASYEFVVESRFQKIRVTVFHRSYDPVSGVVRSTKILSQDNPRWNRGRCRGRWDGKDRQDRISEGLHFLQAQGWLTGLSEDRDWVVALSENTLEVSAGASTP